MALPSFLLRNVAGSVLAAPLGADLRPVDPVTCLRGACSCPAAPAAALRRRRSCALRFHSVLFLPLLPYVHVAALPRAELGLVGEGAAWCALAVAGSAAGKHRRNAASQARTRGALPGWP